jgi:hypothetical protein
MNISYLRVVGLFVEIDYFSIHITMNTGLFLRNIPSDWSMADVCKEFSNYGVVNNFHFQFNKKIEEKLNCGFLYFNNENSVNLILKDDEYEKVIVTSLNFI